MRKRPKIPRFNNFRVGYLCERINNTTTKFFIGKDTKDAMACLAEVTEIHLPLCLYKLWHQLGARATIFYELFRNTFDTGIKFFFSQTRAPAVLYSQRTFAIPVILTKTDQTCNFPPTTKHERAARVSREPVAIVTAVGEDVLSSERESDSVTRNGLFPLWNKIGGTKEISANL